MKNLANWKVSRLGNIKSGLMPSTEKTKIMKKVINQKLMKKIKQQFLKMPPTTFSYRKLSPQSSHKKLFKV